MATRTNRSRPQPGLVDVPALVAQLREAGLPVELQVEGERRELPVGIELSAYRIVQEALTNALKHAGESQRDRQRSLRIRTRSSSRSPTTAQARTGARHERRSRARRHARARRALRRPPRCRPRVRRRLRRPRVASDPMTTVLIADDQALVRVGLRKILDAEPDPTSSARQATARMRSPRRAVCGPTSC